MAGHLHRREGRTRRSRATPALAKKLVEACPVDIFDASRTARRNRRGEPRRVHALRPVHPGRAARQRAHREALRVGDDHAQREGLLPAEGDRRAACPRARSRSGPSRMIHFFDPEQPKMAAKLPDLARQCDVLLGNLEDAIQSTTRSPRARDWSKIGARDRLRRLPALDARQQPRLAVGARRPDDAW